MNKKMIILVGGVLASTIVISLVIMSVVKSLSAKPVKTAVKDEEIDLTLPEADTSILVTATSSKSKIIPSY